MVPPAFDSTDAEKIGSSSIGGAVSTIHGMLQLVGGDSGWTSSPRIHVSGQG